MRGKKQWKKSNDLSFVRLTSGTHPHAASLIVNKGGRDVVRVE